MRILALCSALIGLALLAPTANDPAAAAWALGSLMLLAFAFEHITTLAGLPALLGWLAAGIVLGVNGLDTVRPAASNTLHLVFLISALWLGFQVGLRSAPVHRHSSWRLPAIVGMSTLLTCAGAAAAILLALELPLPMALLFGVVICLWDPLALSSLTANDDAVVVSLIGSAASLVVLSLVFLALAFAGTLPQLATRIVAGLWISLAAGAGAIEVLWQLKVLQRRAAAVIGLLCCFAVVAIVIDRFGLYALPFGLGAGVALSLRDGDGHRLRHLFQPGRQVAVMVFFAMAAASVDIFAAGAWWPPPEGLVQILSIGLALLIAMRVLGPATWFPVPREQGGLERRETWLLLPKGAILFELTFGSDHSLLELATGATESLLRQVILADLVMYAALLSIGAALLHKLLERRQLDTSEDPI